MIQTFLSLAAQVYPVLCKRGCATADRMAAVDRLLHSGFRGIFDFRGICSYRQTNQKCCIQAAYVTANVQSLQVLRTLDSTACLHTIH